MEIAKFESDGYAVNFVTDQSLTESFGPEIVLDSTVGSYYGVSAGDEELGDLNTFVW